MIETEKQQHEGIKSYLNDNNILYAKGYDIDTNNKSGFKKAISIAKSR